MYLNLKDPRKNSGRQPLHGAFKSRPLRVKYNTTTKMAQTDNSRIRGHKNTKPLALIRCMQINLQHSKVATDNLRKIIEQNTDIFMQEPYFYQNRMTGICKSHRNYIFHEDKRRAAIIINKKVDAVLITVIQSRHYTPRTEIQ